MPDAMLCRVVGLQFGLQFCPWRWLDLRPLFLKSANFQVAQCCSKITSLRNF
jgi:hypothetical protein